MVQINPGWSSRDNPAERRFHQRLLILLVLVVGCPAAYLAISRPWGESPEGRPRFQAKNGPQASVRAAGKPAAETGDRLYASGPGRLTLRELLGIVKQELPGPIATRAAQEFMREPLLREEYLNSLGEPDDDMPAAEFVGAIAVRPEFKSLLARFNNDPSFRVAWEAVTKRPEVARMLDEEAGPGTGGNPSAAAAAALAR
ncbi:MAG: hypothetical protein HY554_09760, partial [Elusimicrobia bacterium]|nr:hypothetical protein [Elusimicrobiota bacterium]